VSQYEEEGSLVDVEKRTKEIGKLLSDPTLFPVEFLSWLKRWIEQSGITLPVSSIIGTFTPGAGSLRPFPPGLLIPFAGATAPPGSLACNGQSVSRSEYDLLYAVIGVTWGSVDGSTFNVPDLRGRALFGIGAALALAQNDGIAEGPLRGPKHGHTHSLTLPDHTHSLPEVIKKGSVGATGTSTIFMDYPTTATATGNPATHPAIPGGVGPAGTPPDGPGHAGVLYVITAGA
jgi:microcystin-dependent protein